MSMTYRFQSKAAGDVLMLGPAGDAVLQAMGIAPARQGIVEPAAMPAALRAVEAAVARDEAAPAGAVVHDGDEDGAAVSLRQRAWPLVEMMKRAHAENEPIVWGV